MQAKPNILLILSDQQRRDTLGCYGASQCRTPHIDSLAQRGVRFDSAFPLISPCAPSRAGLFTGRYGHVTRVESNGGRLDQSLPNLATELPRAGYDLGYAGKWHVDHERVPSEWGFRCKRDFPGYGYPASGINMPGLKGGARGDSLISRNYADYLKERDLNPPKLLEAFYGRGNPGLKNRELHGLHAGCIDHKEMLGLAENTIVVFSTDHGDNMGAHKLFEKGPFFDEECFRLPFIAAHPDCQLPGGENDEFVYLQDLFPSFLEAAGLQIDTTPDTQSILRLLAGGEGTTGRDSVYCQFNSQIQTHRSRMVRTRTHKFVFSQSDIGELYDLVNDPHELNNLYGLTEHEELQESLMQLMQSHMERVDDNMLNEFMRVRYIY